MDLPQIHLDLWSHKWSIARTWTVLFVSSGALPIALYFGLRYGTSLALTAGMQNSGVVRDPSL